MTRQEACIAMKYAALNAGVEGKRREKLIYEIEHFRRRLARQGKTMECFFHYAGLHTYEVVIR